MYLVYHKRCKTCRRTVAFMQSVDVFERIIYAETTFQGALSRSDVDQWDQNVILHDLHAPICDRIRPAFPYALITKRIPLLWFIHPLLFLCWTPVFGGPSYSKTVHRMRGIQHPEQMPATANTGNAYDRLVKPRAIVWVGVSLIATNSIFGLMHLVGWPFSSGPAYTHIQAATDRSYAVDRVDRAGKVAVLDSRGLCKWLSMYWLAPIYDNIYRHPERRQLQIAFCKLLRRTVPGWSDATSIRFYVERVSVVPTQWSQNPLERTLFFESKENDSIPTSPTHAVTRRPREGQR